MKVSKNLTVNIGHYQSVKLGLEGANRYEDCDKVLIAELKRLELPITNKIRQCIQWDTPVNKQLLK